MTGTATTTDAATGYAQSSEASRLGAEMVRETALTRATNQYAKSKDMLKGIEGTLSGPDLMEGLTAVISVKVPQPQMAQKPCFTVLEPHW